MATNKQHRSGFAGIRTYAELEASLRMVRRLEEESALTRRVNRFVDGGGISRYLTDFALLAVSILKRWIFKTKK